MIPRPSALVVALLLCGAALPAFEAPGSTTYAQRRAHRQADLMTAVIRAGVEPAAPSEGELAARRQEVRDANVEVANLVAIEEALRRRVDDVRVKIRLIEQVTGSEDLIDRALLAAWRVLAADIATVRAEAAVDARWAALQRNDVERLLAARQAALTLRMEAQAALRAGQARPRSPAAVNPR
jgi:hypothetical protein